MDTISRVFRINHRTPFCLREYKNKNGKIQKYKNIKIKIKSVEIKNVMMRWCDRWTTDTCRFKPTFTDTVMLVDFSQNISLSLYLFIFFQFLPPKVITIRVFILMLLQFSPFLYHSPPIFSFFIRIFVVLTFINLLAQHNLWSRQYNGS